MTSERNSWCWQCHTTRPIGVAMCPACGSELHAGPPPSGSDMLEIDISGMAQGERDEFLLFMDGSDIEHQVFGYLLVISARDEQRTRELLSAVSEDDLVELDPDEVDENSEWARTVAAMMHPSGRCDAVVVVGPSRRVVGAVISYTMWWLLVIVVFVFTTLIASEPTLAMVVAVSMLPLAGETWLTATRGSSPGKYLLNMRIANQAGQPPGWRSAVIRTCVLAWPFMLAYVGGPIGDAAFVFAFAWIILLVFSIARDPDNRGIHDRVAGTRVVDGRMFPRTSAVTANG
ncbi:MAG: RDD family protein [Microthrixaceae bacterium]